MIGIVIVSHSARLAEGVRELVDQMTQGKVPLAVAGGIDDPENPIGTDPVKVQKAIEAVYSDDGVIVLMDLGSALLSAEMALEFLSEKQRAKVRLSAAPLVEGTIAAAVQATASNDIDLIMAEARAALSAKTGQLKSVQPGEVSPPARAETGPRPANQRELTIGNRLGLHARPAAQFVSTAGRFEARITVQNLSQDAAPVNAKSINQVATIGARQGDTVAVAAEGPEAEAALDALQKLVESRFGEDEADLEPEPPARPATTLAQPVKGELTGIPASPGIAIGPATRYRPAPVAVSEQSIANPQAEWQRLQTALETARQEIQTLHRQASTQVGQYEAAIFEVHLLFLEDPALVDETRQCIESERINAEAAWQATVDEMVATYRNLEDAYLQARASDVADVGQRVLKLLTGVVPAAFELSEPAILLAADLTPSDTAQLNPDKLLGICTELGSATAHSAILARALGIPAVVGMGAGVGHVSDGTRLAIDGQTGRLWIEPDAKTTAGLKQERDTWRVGQQSARAAAQAPAVTRDGHQVEVVANINGIADVKGALDNGAEGVGLLRTEFLYLDRVTAPTEEEQLAAYQAIAAALGSRPLIIRTLDIGGDKPLPYLALGQEQNPFLGWRAIRYCLDRSDILETQLRAILRATPGHQIKIMFPMIASLGEFRAARSILASTQQSLKEAGIPFEHTIEVGMMIEVPSAVTMADQLAAEADFFSIGTNDLSQYTMAADRTNARVAGLADAFQPAVLRLVQQVVEAAHTAGIWVGLCGELAGDPLATPILLGLGLDEFSMSAPSIPAVKQTIAQLTVSQTEVIATEALKLESAEAVRAYVKEKVGP